MPSRLEIFDPPKEPDVIPDRDLMHDIKAELERDPSADQPVPVRRIAD